ncbi:unnamed protein product [Prorocentrum cordatum]|uniref:Uncharacterized protein n=1 Tax=Prorocentrum cordatum TaxID=2364126 RepID=A0ABN9SK07_9DINO|nr:unnamed protein product [Polarella glacialis]|mmetsp:Transcript_107963/g.306029  ORF Transcript_107963/g.306029 Transcript_107963/m.306029 type:complete len:119 (-) Transcript_107963:107-463(-)
MGAPGRRRAGARGLLLLAPAAALAAVWAAAAFVKPAAGPSAARRGRPFEAMPPESGMEDLSKKPKALETPLFTLYQVTNEGEAAGLWLVVQVTGALALLILLFGALNYRPAVVDVDVG